SLSSATRCRRSPAPRRRPRQAVPPEQGVLSPAARHPTRRQKRSGVVDRIRPAQAALPSVERSCDHRDQSAPRGKAGTSAAVPCAPGGPETVPASVQALLSNPTACPPWSASQKPTSYESCKIESGNPENDSLSKKICQSSASC